MSEVRHMAVAPTGVQHLAGGDTIDRHRHDDHQLVYVSTGVLAVQTAAGSWVASPDLAVWLPADTWHEHRFYGTSVFHTVSFPTDRPPLPDHAPTIVAVSGLLHELLVACTDPALTPAQERRVRAVIRDQLQYTRQEPISLPTPRDARLSAACEIAASRVAQPVSLASLAQQIGASQRTLSRLFRAELGMTYPQWRTRLRVLHAMILLAGGHSVTDTAHQCGWATTSSFIDTFRRAMGQTPGAYKPTTI
jgi:AraC-like DNA-binding protein